MRTLTRILAKLSFLAAMLAASVVGAQPMEQCRPPAAYCNALLNLSNSPDRFIDVGVGVAAGWPVCLPGARQRSSSECQTVLLRLSATSTVMPPGVVAVGVGRGVLVLPQPQFAPTPAAPTRAGSGRDSYARRELRNIWTQRDADVQIANDNNQHFESEIDRARAAAAAAQRVASSAQGGVYALGWRILDLREEFRVRFMVPMRYTWQPGGSPTLGIGVGFGLTRWGQGSSLGIDGDVNFHAYEYQPAAPGATPLFGATFGLHMVIGRGMVQGLVGASGGTAFRFGDAGPGQVTGGTQFNLGLGGGIRLEAPFYPTSRPGGARIFGQLLTHLGGGAVNAVVAGQPPLHAGFVLDLQVAIGVAL